MSNITDERINQLRSSIHKLRVFLNYSNSMKKQDEEKEKVKDEKVSQNFNEDKILQIKAVEQTKDVGLKDKKIESNKSRIANVSDSKITILPGNCVVNEGEEGDSAFLIVSGSFNVEIEKKVIGSMAAGEIFGELSLILGEKRKATVRAVTGSELVEINSSFLKDYFLSSKTSDKEVISSKLDVRKLIKELSAELGKKKDHKLFIDFDRVLEIVECESNIIKTLAIHLHRRISRMIADTAKRKTIAEIQNQK